MLHVKCQLEEGAVFMNVVFTTGINIIGKTPCEMTEKMKSDKTCPNSKIAGEQVTWLF